MRIIPPMPIPTPWEPVKCMFPLFFSVAAGVGTEAEELLGDDDMIVSRCMRAGFVRLGTALWSESLLHNAELLLLRRVAKHLFCDR